MMPKSSVAEPIELGMVILSQLRVSKSNPVSTHLNIMECTYFCLFNTALDGVTLGRHVQLHMFRICVYIYVTAI